MIFEGRQHLYEGTWRSGECAYGRGLIFLRDGTSRSGERAYGLGRTTCVTDLALW